MSPERDSPVLYGDGRHDDVEALEALARGEDVRYPDGTRAAWPPRPGEYCVSRTLHLSRNWSGWISNNARTTILWKA